MYCDFFFISLFCNFCQTICRNCLFILLFIQKLFIYLCWCVGRYVISPELRAEKLEKLYNNGDVNFMRKFWFLPEQGFVQVFLHHEYTLKVFMCFVQFVNCFITCSLNGISPSCVGEPTAEILSPSTTLLRILLFKSC